MSFIIDTNKIPNTGLKFCEVIDKSLFASYFSNNEEQSLEGNVSISILLEKLELCIKLKGKLSLELILSCSRCLKEVIYPINVPIDLVLFRKNEHFKTYDELENHLPSIAEDKNVLSEFIDSNKIDLIKLIYEIVQISVPFKHLCKESCRGLCDRCGENLNLKTCSCKKDDIDPRLEALKNIKIS